MTRPARYPAIFGLCAFARCGRGASAVEFAMLLPLFLVFGIVVFGAYLTMVHGVQQLAAEAARSSVAGLSETERVSLAENYVTTNAASYPLLEADRLTVSAATSGSAIRPAPSSSKQANVPARAKTTT